LGGNQDVTLPKKHQASSEEFETHGKKEGTTRKRWCPQKPLSIQRKDSPRKMLPSTGDVNVHGKLSTTLKDSVPPPSQPLARR